MRNYYLIFIVSSFFFACSDDPKPQSQLSVSEMQEALLNANINAAKLESEQIDVYVNRLKLNFIKTGTGLRYVIYQSGLGTIFPKEDSKVAINYSVTLLDGTACYSTEGIPEELIVGKSYAESGLQEALTYMKEGDKAKVIIPSHLAHGLAGDLKKIPYKSTIVYDLELVDVK